MQKVHNAVVGRFKLNESDKTVKIQCHVCKLFVAFLTCMVKKLKRKQVLTVINRILCLVVLCQCPDDQRIICRICTRQLFAKRERLAGNIKNTNLARLKISEAGRLATARFSDD